MTFCRIPPFAALLLVARQDAGTADASEAGEAGGGADVRTPNGPGD